MKYYFLGLALFALCAFSSLAMLMPTITEKLIISLIGIVVSGLLVYRYKLEK